MKIRRLDPRAALPQRTTSGSAGMDLRALLDQPVILKPGERRRIPTGIAIALPSADTVGLIFARSGLSTKYGIALTNGVGVIDSDYTGEIQIGLINLSDTPYEIAPGERIAQLVVTPILRPSLTEVDALEPTARAEGGFGSTGSL